MHVISKHGGAVSLLLRLALLEQKAASLGSCLGRQCSTGSLLLSSRGHYGWWRSGRCRVDGALLRKFGDVNVLRTCKYLPALGIVIIRPPTRLAIHPLRILGTACLPLAPVCCFEYACYAKEAGWLDIILCGGQVAMRELGERSGISNMSHPSRSMSCM